MFGKDDANTQRSMGVLYYTGGIVYAFIFGSNNNYSDRQSVALINDGNWHHIVITWATGSSPDVYVDGVLTNGSTFNGATGGVRSTTPPITLGSAYNMGNYSGSIDDVALLNSVLTAEQIASIYTGGVNVLSLSPVALWRMEEGSGLSTVDQSGNSYTGTLSGGVTWSADIPEPLETGGLLSRRRVEV
jgi:hypothetical protein